MATRPVFVVSLTQQHFVKVNISFEYFSGFSISQKQKCIQSLHNAFLKNNKDKSVLEISTKSLNPLGVKLSAFNLMIKTISGKVFSVETAFQASKVFEHGGPYKDLLLGSSKAAKTDSRLRNSGKILSFFFNKQSFPVEPKTFFYNWLYINALHCHKVLAENILAYDAFTDIEFNPNRSLNCQAEAAAIYVSLQQQGMLDDALKSKENFLEIIYGNELF